MNTMLRRGDPIDEELQDDDIHELSRDISCMPGVYSACVKRPCKTSDAG